MIYYISSGTLKPVDLALSFYGLHIDVLYCQMCHYYLDNSSVERRQIVFI